MEKPVDATELLRSIPLFEGLEEDDLIALSATLVPCEYRSGMPIFAQGDEGSSMYIVESGDVNIHLPGEDSRRISLKDISRGEFFGELALFDDKPRSASAQATSPTVLLELQRETLENYLDRRPRAAMAILRTMSERLRETNTMLSARAAKNVDAEFDENLSWSDRLADAVAELNGSWKFILILIGITAGWCVANTNLVLSSPLDPYPYQFFNLALGILVGLQGPLIVMSQNRQSLKDRARADTDFKVNLKNEVGIETLVRELSEFRAEMDDRLDRLDKTLRHD
jgi:CRP/FNR family cyclic AMP-dependent transcriptional regulator